MIYDQIEEIVTNCFFHEDKKSLNKNVYDVQRKIVSTRFFGLSLPMLYPHICPRFSMHIDLSS